MWISRGGMRLVWHAVAFVGCGCLGIVARITQVSAAPQHAELCTEPIESADGARNDKTAMLYGLMLSDDPHAVEREYAHKLAINDLKTVLPGGTLPGGFNGMRRPVALVICTKGRPENDSVTIRAANHLIRQVGVSAIVTQTTRQALATQQAIAASGASVLHICEGCTVLLREAMRGMGDSSLVFQAFAPRPSFSAFIHAKLPEFEAYVRELRGFDGSPRIRVALIRPDNDVFRPLAATTDETLVINGAKASLQRGTNYLHATYASLSKPSTPAEVGARIAAFRPQIIYAAVGAGPVTRLVGSDLARGIANTQLAGAKQVYIGRRDLVSGLADAVAGPVALNSLNNAYPLNWSQSSTGAPMVGTSRLYCFTRNATGALVETSAGQVWEARTNSITGTFVPCR